MGISLGILVTFNKTHQAVFAASANEVTGRIDEKYNNIQYYFNLKKTNTALAEQNASLMNSLRTSFDAPDSSVEQKIDSLSKDTLGRVRRFYFMPAKVVNSSVNEENNYLTLYRGSKQGVTRDMSVVGPNGIVGKVILVSDNFCRVMSLLNHNTKVSAMLKKDNYNGIVEWDGNDPLILTMHGIPKSAKVQKGDTVLTSNLSGTFPPGLMIGTIVSVNTDPASNFFVIELKSATNFYNLQYAFVVQNMLWDEQKKLEALTPKNQ
jgi:rod shape-determining protein MreC